MRTFEEINIQEIIDRMVYLDIDGTITFDGGEALDEETVVHIKKLAETNTVFFVSNGNRQKRDIALAEALGITHWTSRAYKPFTRFFHTYEPSKKALVIGDKFLTDGLFALTIGAPFIKVTRKTHHSSSFSTHLVHQFDDSIYQCMQLILAVRPIQHIRSLLIFAPLFFAGVLYNEMLFVQASIAFLAFCALVGAVYIGNDLIDVDADRLHPKKRMRPLARGELTIGIAQGACVVLLALSFATAYMFVSQIIPLLLVYLVANVWYSLQLKDIIVVDIVVVASFYLLRIEVGGFATGIHISNWLLLTTFFLALFLVVGKRFAEVRGSAIREVSRVYTESYLLQLLTLSATATLLCYGIYTILGTPHTLMVYSTLPVILGIFRYLFLLTTEARGESPERIIFKDPVIVSAVLCWALILVKALYVT